MNKEIKLKVKGIKGDTGLQGEQGIQGIPGLNGKDGLNGRDGKDGLNGKDGKNGVKGEKGKDGLDGKDGSPDTPQQVKSKLLEVGLKYNELQDLPNVEQIVNNIRVDIPKMVSNLVASRDYDLKELKDVITIGATDGQALIKQGDQYVFETIESGGVQSIVAGTNISVDNTDPLNPTISSLADRYKTTSTTSHAVVSTGTLTFTVEADLSYISQQDVIIAHDSSNHMHGTIVSYSGTTMVVDIQHKTGSGTYSLWDINLDGISAGIPTLQEVTNEGYVTTTALEASSFIKTGGTSSDFLKADGSIDSTTYLSTSSSLASLVDDTGINGNLHFNDNGVIGGAEGTFYDKILKGLRMNTTYSSQATLSLGDSEVTVPDMTSASVVFKLKSSGYSFVPYYVASYSFYGAVEYESGTYAYSTAPFTASTTSPLASELDAYNISAIFTYVSGGYTASSQSYSYEIYALYDGDTATAPTGAVTFTSDTADSSGNPCSVEISWTAPTADTPSSYIIVNTSTFTYTTTTSTSVTDDGSWVSGIPSLPNSALMQFELTPETFVFGDYYTGYIFIDDSTTSYLFTNSAFLIDDGSGVFSTGTGFTPSPTTFSTGSLITEGKTQLAKTGTFSIFDGTPRGQGVAVEDMKQVFVDMGFLNPAYSNLNLGVGTLQAGSLIASSISVNIYRGNGQNAGTPTFSFISDGNTGMFSPLADNLAWSTGGTERFRITSTGVFIIGGTSPHASAMLQVDSTTKGFLPPRMTTTQRTAISATAGLIVYDTTTNKSYTYDGTAWQAHY